MPQRVKVFWSESALNELLAIVRYIKLDKPDVAREFARKLKEKVSQLSQFPDRGRLVPEIPEYGYRELVIGNYRVIYDHIKAKNVVRVLHVKTSWQALEKSGD